MSAPTHGGGVRGVYDGMVRGWLHSMLPGQVIREG